MKLWDRILIYGIGFAIGTTVLSFYWQFKSARADLAEQTYQQYVGNESQLPFPKSLPEVFRQGQVLVSGSITNTEGEGENVWIVEYKKSYPFVRIVENPVRGSVEIMAADQVLLYLHAGVDVTDLQPALNSIGLRVRMFNRDEQVMVVSVLDNALNAVPKTLEALEPWSDLLKSSTPDYIIQRKIN